MSERQIKKRKIDTDNKISTENKDEIKDNNVTLFFDVVKILFKYLLGKDLNNAAMVCRLWQDVASSEIEKRNSITKLCNWKEAFDNPKSKNHFSNYLTTKPMLGFLFNAADESSLDSLSKYVPKNCVTLLINNAGIVFNDKENEDAIGNVLMTYLTYNSDVKIEYIVETSKRITNFDKKLNVLYERQLPTKLRMATIFNDSFKRLKNVKCFIYLTSQKASNGIHRFYIKPLKNYSNALWGGVSDSLTICKKNKNEEINSIAILISGSKIDSWSIVIRSRRNDKNIVEERLLEMKSNIKSLFKHTIGFMYACVGRGERFYSEKNVESSLFKKVFPNIPLVGCFGSGGEYGTTTVGSEAGTGNKFYQYSTAFMILTYG
ncbi:F-box only protein 22-like [Aphidius gifuensis]|uniref:F-box only protein 22-like n=1 Tax=Aphidius gifuensis TaxID=684658 RepID=UPI001CDC0556|nr:F-box only protein 22-like [Aphidius gifuensis]